MHAGFLFSKSEYTVIIIDDNLCISYGANKWYLDPSVLIYFTWPLSPTLGGKKQSFSLPILLFRIWLRNWILPSNLLSWVIFICRMENSRLPSGDGYINSRRKKWGKLEQVRKKETKENKTLAQEEKTKEVWKFRKRKEGKRNDGPNTVRKNIF